MMTNFGFSVSFCFCCSAGPNRESGVLPHSQLYVQDGEARPEQMKAVKGATADKTPDAQGAESITSSSE